LPLSYDEKIIFVEVKKNVVMKGSSLIVSIILFVLIGVLYILHFTGGNGEQAAGSDEVRAGASEGLKIAYIKTDSLILNYVMAEALHDDFTQKQEAYTQEYGNKRTVFEREAAEFQQKLQRGGFLTEQRAIQERDRLVGKEQEILKLDQDLSTKLAEMQNANNQQIIDSLMSYLKVYNANNKYDYILNAADVLIGPDSDNITAEILAGMNSRYQASLTTK
jgi:outer membrane protein